MQVFVTFLVLAGMWCLLSGMFDALHLGLGLVVAAAITLASQRWRSPQALPVWRLLAYLPWLTWAVMKSNLHVAWLVLARRQAIAPRFVEMQPGVRGDHALTLLGGSITLTPGTVTVEIEPDRMLVHTLDEASMGDIENGAMARRVQRVFADAPEEVRP